MEVPEMLNALSKVKLLMFGTPPVKALPPSFRETSGTERGERKGFGSVPLSRLALRSREDEAGKSSFVGQDAGIEPVSAQPVKLKVVGAKGPVISGRGPHIEGLEMVR